MPRIGAHMSVAGGLYKAVEAAAGLGMETVQIFTHSPSQWAVRRSVPIATGGAVATPGDETPALPWRAKPLDPAEVARFRAAIDQSGIEFACAHDSYLINLASPDDGLWHKSIDAFVAELERSEELGLIGVVMHPGSFVNSSEAKGLERIVAALDEVHRRTPRFTAKTLLETTAGQGTNLGHRFEQLAYVIDHVRRDGWVGVCVDTCHIFAAGYPLATKTEYAATFAEFDRLIGVERICAFHLNDSVRELGSRVDRHARIGAGKLGLEPFRHLLNDRRFADRPMYMETPKGEAEGESLDAINLRMLRSLVRG